MNIEQFLPLIGFREEAGFSEILTEDDKESLSGLFFQDAHPLILLSYIKDAAPLVQELQMTDEEFMAWLRGKKESSIKKVIASLIQQRKLSDINKTILNKSLSFDGVANIADKEIKEGRFVGYLLVVKNPDQVVAVLEQICLQFTEKQEELNLYIYHSSKNTPIDTISLPIVKENAPRWSNVLSKKLSCEKSQEFGGYWVIGYYEDDLVGQALNVSNYNFLRGGCNCGGVNHWEQWSKHLSIQPIYVNHSDLLEERELPDENTFVYTPENKSYGLNLMLSTVCDLETILNNQKNVFAQAIFLQFAVDMLQEIAYTTRTSSISEKIQQKANFELEDKENSLGLRSRCANEIKAVNIELEKIGAICMPKHLKIKYKSIG